MDNFCMGCHDSDTSRGAGLGGAAQIAVNAAGDGLTLSPTAAQRLAPFNPTDNLREGGSTGSAKVDNSPGASNFPERTAVIDAYGQFATTNASHHAVRGARYNTHNSNWGTGAWVSRTLKNGTALTTVYEAATLHCSDCHTVDANAHSGSNPFMMQAATIDDTCYLCHNSGVYSDAAGAGSRVNHDMCGHSFDLTSTFGNSQCLKCHGGEPGEQLSGQSRAVYGGIHGNNASGSTSGAPISGTRYRFVGGLMGMFQPGTSATVNWTTSGTAVNCYMQAGTNNWSNCERHYGSGPGSKNTTNYTRQLNY